MSESTAPSDPLDPTLHVLIVDDEAPARSRLRVVLTDIAAEVPTKFVGEAATGAEALELLATIRPDVAFLDIRMPDMDGLELARHISNMPNPPAVIFTTAYDQHAVEAFELNAVDYLMKPVRAQRLVAALNKARRVAPISGAILEKLTTTRRRHLSISERGRILLVPIGDIIYLKAELKYVTARTRERDFLLDESLTHLEQEFGQRFVRIHRNCLVARAAITGFSKLPKGRASSNNEESGEKTVEAETNWTVTLSGLNEALPVSRRLWSGVKAAFSGEN